MGNVCGIIGATLFILAYFLLQRDKEFAKHWLYSFINFVAAAFMLSSLFYDWNIGALINNFFWIILSSYGLAGFIRARKHSSAK